MALLELTGAVARLDAAGEGTMIICERLQGKLRAALDRTSYSGVEAATFLGVSAESVRRGVLGQSADKIGRALAISPVDLYRFALLRVTMALRRTQDGALRAGSVPVKEACAARAVDLTEVEVDVLAAEMRAAAGRDGEEGVVRLAGWLTEIGTGGERVLPLVPVTRYYARLLHDEPWDLTRRGLFYRTKVASGVMRIIPPPGRRRVHLRMCGVRARDVLVLGRNTWAVAQVDGGAVPPPVKEILPC